MNTDELVRLYKSSDDSISTVPRSDLVIIARELLRELRESDNRVAELERNVDAALEVLYCALRGVGYTSRDIISAANSAREKITELRRGTK